MGQRHKHADVIIAWAEGKDVQVWDFTQNEWGDVTIESPTWCKGLKYRIKPTTKKYRVALFSSHSGESLVVACNSPATAENYESLPGFVRWLTDWIEYEE